VRREGAVDTLISMNTSMLIRSGLPLVRRCLLPQKAACGRTCCLLGSAA
jgi:hypothetical protein